MEEKSSTSCCSAGRGEHEALADRPAPISGSAGNRRAKAVNFPAAIAFVGTDRPIIRFDGEGPRRAVRVKSFALETTAVTNDRFSQFVADTGYITEAERYGWSPVFQGLLPAGTSFSVTNAQTPWWIKIDGADWAHPEGPGTSVSERLDHPVVHVSWADAKAFAAWVGGRLPTEAEWEHAARGGLADPRYPWGDEEPDEKRVFCNIWQGTFPHTNTLADGFLGTSPVDAFEPNGSGLFNMAGNVWEWTSDAFRVRSLTREGKRRNADAAKNGEKILKGGSFLCHKSYCYRYRIAARSALPADSSASNMGFRIAYDG